MASGPYFMPVKKIKINAESTPGMTSERQSKCLYLILMWMNIYSVQFSCSVVSNSVQPHGLQHARLPCPSPSPGVCSNSCSLSCDAFQSCHPLSSPSPPVFVFPRIRVFSNESVLRIRWSKYWSFSFSISTSNEYSGLISFRMDWLDLLADQRTLKSLLQHYSSKTLILRCTALSIVQISHPYMTTGKTIALTKQNFVDKVMSLLFNMLSRLVITFLPRSKYNSELTHLV